MRRWAGFVLLSSSVMWLTAFSLTIYRIAWNLEIWHAAKFDGFNFSGLEKETFWPEYVVSQAWQHGCIYIDQFFSPGWLRLRLFQKRRTHARTFARCMGCIGPSDFLKYLHVQYHHYSHKVPCVRNYEALHTYPGTTTWLAISICGILILLFWPKPPTGKLLPAKIFMRYIAFLPICLSSKVLLFRPSETQACDGSFLIFNYEVANMSATHAWASVLRYATAGDLILTSATRAPTSRCPMAF